MPIFDMVSQALGFAKCAHRHQARKYTGKPYVNHCRAVATMVGDYSADPRVVAAAVLHDVIEDTEITADELRSIFGDRLTSLVLEVTDVSRPGQGNRATRKAIDRAHLAKASREGATIKLADLIDNAKSIARDAPDFAPVYLAEKEALLAVLQHGDKMLWSLANEVLNQARKDLARMKGISEERLKT